MSVRIHIKSSKYDHLSCAQRAEVDRKRKERLTQVREQSNRIAKDVRARVQKEKENQLRKFQQIQQQEFCESKKNRQCEIQREYGNCLAGFGAAHIAACDASCEEDEVTRQKREEYDLLAAQRGRSAMLQEQRKRDREAEERLAKRKRKQQKNAAVQADIVSRKEFGANFCGVEEEIDSDDQSEESEEDEDEGRNEVFTSKPNLHKSSASAYNPKNFTSNSVDSSNNRDSDESTSRDVESEEEFNQIKNILKKKSYETDSRPSSSHTIESSDSSDIEVVPRSLPKEKQKKVVVTPKKKGILKTTAKKSIAVKPKVTEKSKKPSKEAEQQQRVKYVDFSNKYSTNYVPSEDLVTDNRPSTKSNAFVDAAQKHERAGLDNISEGVLRQLAEIRHKEALEKEKTRRDYERLRVELAELEQQEKEAKEAAGKALRNISSSQLNRQEESRKAKMNEAVEKTFKRNIITCPPVDSTAPKATKEKSCEVNVAGPGNRTRLSSKSDSITIIEQSKKPSSELKKLVETERLKDLLERINHQKNLLMREIEKSDDIPGPDLDKVMKCLEKLENEKAALSSGAEAKADDAESRKKAEELKAREEKLKEREKKLENGVRELYKSQKVLVAAKQPESVATSTSESSNGIPPVEIIIKVQSKSPRKSKHRKSIRCLDTLHREPGKVYPRTPRKQKSTEGERKQPEPAKVQQETQTTPSLCEAPKTILKKPTQASPPEPSRSRKSDDSSQSVSTTYQSLPERITVAAPTAGESNRKTHHKLNPVLMHYITRLLGMGKNIDKQLHVDVSSVSTPGSSTINTSGNKSNVSDAQAPQFDQKRLEKLQDFINDNYSFLGEVNESLERSRIQEQTEDNISKVDGIWNEVLRKKKTPRPVSSQTVGKPSKQPPSRPPPPSQTKLTLTRPSTATQTKQPLPTLVLRPPPSMQPTQTRRPSTAAQSSQPRVDARSLTRPTASDMLTVTTILEGHMMNNYKEYTENCQKRADNLARMIKDVRQERQKLIEDTLSSGEFGHFTEYREIAEPGKKQDPPTTSASDLKESPSQREDPPSEEINNILQKQTRPFGVSKDSGISMWSRPVTSSDFRDSPDARVTSEERENTFQPILKDIPKPPRVKVTSTDGGSTETLKDVSLLIKEQEEKAQRKLRPPLSLNRFSPHLEKPHEAHELSTIAEVETPTASKVNLLEKIDENVAPGIESFPNFEEYAKTLQGQSQQAGESTSSFATFGDLHNVLDEIKLKSFAAPKDFGIAEISKEDEIESASSDSSIMDIEEELKRRNIINEPFVYGDSKENTTPTNTAQQEEPKSPKKAPPQSRILIKVPDNVDIEIQSTPSKRRRSPDPNPDVSPKSNDTLTGIQELDKEQRHDLDLHGMGLGWAESMLKRDVASQKLQSSSSSSSAAGKSIEIDIQTSTCERSASSSSSNSVGRPLNLRDFLSRELKLKADRENSPSDESSLSSQFMRSLLKKTSANSSSLSRSGEGSDAERVRTSTPLQGKGSSSAHRSSNTQLFPGDSLSTLKGSEGDASGKSDKSNKKQ